jgi:predicted AAA+ superfamily ATPase
MLKSIVLKQKEEKERLLSLPYIERTKEKEAKKWLSSDLIKVILGPRRAGKSVFSLMLLKDHSFAYFNFDDESLPSEDQLDLNELMQELKLAYGDTKYILFDEIQNVPKWELFVSRLHREGYNLVITGSNARLLSKELATALTGRHIPIQILPFDFNEILRAKKFEPTKENVASPAGFGQLLNILTQYMTNGGYPEVVLTNIDPRGYLDVLFDSLLFKDVVRRHHVRFSGQIDSLGTYLVNNFTSLYSIRKMTVALGSNSGTTIEKYLGYLTEAYVVFTLNRFSAKVGLRLQSPKKAYVVDNGFVTAKAVQNSPNSGKLMENLVFTELVKQGNEPGRELFYYHTRNQKEVDFVIKKGNEVLELIQVCYDLRNPEVEQREVRALVEAGKELGLDRLTILTWNDAREIKKDDITIQCTPLHEWLLDLNKS